MTVRNQYAYRLTVVLPDEPTLDEWEPVWNDMDGTESFHWPRWQRYYFSQGGAKKRADLLRKYGATVDIQRSLPIVWPTT